MSRSDVESKLGLNFGSPPGFRRLRLTISYCGTAWRGWQSLAGGRTIQDELNAAVFKAIRVEVMVQGSGRTDAGVHALAQVAHMDVPEILRMSEDAWAKALNACLPLTIRVMQVDRLIAGEVGYLAASIKSVADARVGDTITLRKNGATKALPGAKPHLTPLSQFPLPQKPG